MNLVGRTLGPYTLEAPLGKGGMAAVYRAYQASVRRYVAIKVMAQDIANEPGFVERFAREATVIASLEHPHILPVIDYGEHDGVHYIVMRYMDGGSLDDVMRKRQLAFEDIGNYLGQISSALDYAHKHGVVHRDLKPNNVLLDKDQNCYLTDFGIARLEGSERKLTQTGSVMGTPSYMSPEQAMGRMVDGRSDLYTLGVMLYEMVLGKLPFSADTPAALIFQHVYEQPASPKLIRPDTPDSVVAVIDRALAKSPDTRYQSGFDLTNAFMQAIGARTATPTQPTAPVGEFDKTFVGGGKPATAYPSATPGGTPTMPPVIPPTQAGYSRTPAIPGVSATPLGATSTSESDTVRRGRAPVGLIVAAVAIVVLLGVAGALVVSNNNNNNAAAQTQTQVAVAIAALSATPTATPTSTVTPTPTSTPTDTLTFTPSPTETNSPTPTPNETTTAIANQMATVSAFSLGQTATIEAHAAATSTAIVHGTSTAIAEQLATVVAFNATQTAIGNANRTATTDAARAAIATRGAAANATATARANPTDAPTATVDTFDTFGTLTAVAIMLGGTDGGTGTGSNNPSEIIAAVVGGGLIPADRQVLNVTTNTDPTFITGNIEKTNIFYVDEFSRARFTNFVFSANIAVSSSAAATDETTCGLFYNGGNDTLEGTEILDLDMVPVYFYRSTRYRVDTRKGGQWSPKAVYSNSSSAIKALNKAVNRLTIVVVDNKLTAFINGTRALQVTDQTLEDGFLGYFMIRGAAGAAERCDFSDIYVWRVN